MSGILDRADAFEATARIGGEIARERVSQVQRFGVQNHPDGTGGECAAFLSECARQACENASRAGALTWLDILREETEEAAAESDPTRLRAELLQVAAVAVAWIEAIDRRSKHPQVSRGRTDA